MESVKGSNVELPNGLWTSRGVRGFTNHRQWLAINRVFLVAHGAAGDDAGDEPSFAAPAVAIAASGMAFEFPRWSDTAFRVALFGIALAMPGVFVIPMVYVRTPYNLNRHFPIEQPVQFDHRHHAGDDQIQCLYCHSGADHTPYAGIPPTEVCMGCHSQVWNQSAMLEPVRRSYFSGQAIPWKRVHLVPDFVYFNHAVHVSRARIECGVCHGDVRREPLVQRERLFTMGWCLDCHRSRQGLKSRAATPAEAALADNWLPPPAAGHAPTLVGQAPLTSCTTCHR